MQANQPTSDTDSTQATNGLRDLARSARFAELLDPDEFSLYAAETLPSCRERGYAIRTVLAPGDVDLLADDAVRGGTRLAVGKLDDGLPFVVISLEFDARRFRWVVPMWQSGAQEWLADSIRQRRALLAIEATDLSVAVSLNIGGVFEEARLLASMTHVSGAVPAEQHVASLLAAAHLGALARLESYQETASLWEDVRVMVAAQGKAAHEVMAAWASLALSIDTQVPPLELLLY